MFFFFAGSTGDTGPIGKLDVLFSVLINIYLVILVHAN